MGNFTIVRERDMKCFDGAIFNEEVDVYAFKIYVYLCSCCYKNCEFDTSSIKFSKILNISKSSLIKGLRQLQDKKLIQIEKRFNQDGGRNTNLVRILNTKKEKI